ncbi:hypothetical protein UFOVP124_45 [uncultured Caudovirales phage]|uniref:Uncharacterized protein n=1 Tax=uncultured Caudovirales phage TaxID=2100421 RepID=A0A6J5L8X2_9CAUD|nr:hypothetical protein UFOVP124_45 [uncultured Caudovirales phage]
MPQIDAIIVPSEYAPANDPYNEMARLATEFGPILKVRQLIKKTLSDGRIFLPKTPDDTFLFPSNHPRHPQERYTWTERDAKDGVLYGTLIKDDTDAQ